MDVEEKINFHELGARQSMKSFVEAQEVRSRQVSSSFVLFFDTLDFYLLYKMIGILSSYLNHVVQLWVTARPNRRGLCITGSAV